MKWLLLFVVLATPLWAVTPSEMLGDAALEARARAISQGLRCPVCQNESIDGSGASVAADLRLLVRERLVQGDSDAEVVSFIVARYGEFVLLRPKARGGNLLLWLAGPLLLFVGSGGVFVTLRRNRTNYESAELSQAEADKLAQALKDMP